MRAKLVKENISGGAGYSVYGGGYRGGFGTPSLGSGGRGRGFGGGANLSGGPNLMYTYSVKPLTQDLQPNATPQDGEEYIHTGSKIKGTILNTDQKIEGQIVHVEEDHDNNIKYYVVLDPEDGMQKKVDPTSVYLIQPEDSFNPFVQDTAVEESFYPSLFEENITNETTNVKEKIEKSKKLSKEMKEKIIPMIVINGIHGTKYKKGRVTYLKTPKIPGKSFLGNGIGADKDGFFVFTHRARSKSYPELKNIPNKDIKFIESTG